MSRIFHPRTERTPEEQARRDEWLALKAEAAKAERERIRADMKRKLAAQDREAEKVRQGKRIVASVGRLSI